MTKSAEATRSLVSSMAPVGGGREGRQCEEAMVRRGGARLHQTPPPGSEAGPESECPTRGQQQAAERRASGGLPGGDGGYRGAEGRRGEGERGAGQLAPAALPELVPQSGSTCQDPAGVLASWGRGDSASCPGSPGEAPALPVKGPDTVPCLPQLCFLDLQLINCLKGWGGGRAWGHNLLYNTSFAFFFFSSSPFPFSRFPSVL